MSSAECPTFPISEIWRVKTLLNTLLFPLNIFQCQDTFVQFSSFLSSSLTIDEVSKRLPKLDDLLTQYYVAPDAAFALCRPLYASQIEKKFEEFKKADRKDKEKQTTAARVGCSNLQGCDG